MARILVSGVLNVETTLQVDGFPVAYAPVRYPRHGVSSGASGVGFNVAKALATLGSEVRFASLIGRDLPGELVRRTLQAIGISDRFVQDDLQATPQSVILVDPDGRRQVNTDLKDLPDRTALSMPSGPLLAGCDLAVLCNANFSRSLIPEARRQGIPIATDVHAIADLDDAYNRDFMAAADVLFMSDERLPCPPEEWVERLLERYSPRIVVIGMGAAGAYLAAPSEGVRGLFPAIATRPVVNTVGAGDALFSSFVHFYLQLGEPQAALRRAQVFAGHKIGESGGSQGFLDARGVEEQLARHSPG